MLNQNSCSSVSKKPNTLDNNEDYSLPPRNQRSNPYTAQMSAAQRGQLDGIQQLSDYELCEKIKSTHKTYSNVGSKLADKGEKLLANINRLEAERERRKLRRVELDVNKTEKSMQSTSSIVVGVPGGSKHKTSTLSEDPTKSEFTKKFLGKIEDRELESHKAYDRELSKGSDGHNMHRKAEEKGRNGNCLQPSVASSQRISNDDYLPYGDQKGTSSSFPHVGQGGRKFLRHHKKDTANILISNGTKSLKGPAHILLDEDESSADEMGQEEDEPSQSMKEPKIYYPSREDPEAIEICPSDIDCLAPEGYLSSTIMNFYIRYLEQQASLTNKTLSDYHFFNTYFYKKLREALSNKGSDKEAFFVKFRRWWKGVNIFQKAYIFVPIHEEHHWSLVIICIPDKEDKSGPILLHLDSLGIHSSGIVFKNIKSYLLEEWKYLKQEVSLSQLPFIEKIWENLPRRIEEKQMSVPQQRNDYDCGLFVLFFMERFIEEAPERLKKKDFAMFGRKWFRPEEASGLRKKIKVLLTEFKNACEISL